MLQVTLGCLMDFNIWRRKVNEKKHNIANVCMGDSGVWWVF
jgi:hypothetical protein